MKVDVLFEIQARVSRVTVFDKIRENSFLHQSSHSHSFESKTNSINLVSSKSISLSSIHLFETNSTQFGH